MDEFSALIRHNPRDWTVLFAALILLSIITYLFLKQLLSNRRRRNTDLVRTYKKYLKFQYDVFDRGVAELEAEMNTNLRGQMDHLKKPEVNPVPGPIYEAAQKTQVK